MTEQEPDYVVIRPAADLPEGFLPARYDGLWLDRAGMPMQPSWLAKARAKLGEAVAVPSGRFEVRAVVAVAEVWEVRP